MGQWACALEGVAVSAPLSTFWRDKRVLVTGHTGFKGAWLCHWLMGLGARVSGLALYPGTQPNLYALLELPRRLVHDFHRDIRDGAHWVSTMAEVQPDIVLHLAAQALVREGYRQPVETFSTNVMGTVQVLEAVQHTPSVRAVVVVTTDKVYRNEGESAPFRETDPLGGSDPYSASKACSEMVAACYGASFLGAAGVGMATARAGNVIGGGDWAPERLVPDAIRAWSQGSPVLVRNPGAIRPWQHVLEPLAGYLSLAQRLWEKPEEKVHAWNFGPPISDCVSVEQLLSAAASHWGSGARIDIRMESAFHESRVLRLDASKAAGELGCRPRWNTGQAIERSVAWYRQQRAGQAPQGLCDADIAAWESS